MRDLPEEKAPRHPWRRLVLQGFLLVTGFVLTAGGFAMEGGYPLLLGPVLAVFSLGFLLSRALPVRFVWTLVGAGVLAYAYFANEFEAVARSNEDSPAMFFV